MRTFVWLLSTLLILAVASIDLPMFEDPRLESAIRAELGIETGNLTRSNLREITHVTASGLDIASLSGLENCPHLEYLDVSKNHITSLAPLAHLFSLQTLVLNSNQVTDIDPLFHLTRLTRLDLDFNFVTDISPLGWDCGTATLQIFLP